MISASENGCEPFFLWVTELQDIIYTLTWGAERVAVPLTLLSSVNTWDFLLAHYGKVIHLVFWDVIFRKACFCFSERLKCTDAFISAWECTLITKFPHKWGLPKNNSEGARFLGTFVYALTFEVTIFCLSVFECVFKCRGVFQYFGNWKMEPFNDFSNSRSCIILKTMLCVCLL